MVDETMVGETLVDEDKLKPIDKNAWIERINRADLSPEEYSELHAKIQLHPDIDNRPIILGSDEEAQFVEDRIKGHEEGTRPMDDHRFQKYKDSLETHAELKRYEGVQDIINFEPIESPVARSLESDIETTFMGLTGMPAPHVKRREVDKSDPTERDYYKFARQNGVDTSTGIDISLFEDGGEIHMLSAYPDAQYGLMEYQARKAMKEAGIDFPQTSPAIVQDPYTGEPAYYRVEWQGHIPRLRLTLINPEGVGPQEMLGLGMELPKMVTEGAAAFGGMYAATAAGMPGAGVPAAAVTSGAMAAVNNRIYKKIARSFAEDEDMTDLERRQINESLDKMDGRAMFFDVMFAMGGESVAGLALGGTRFFANKLYRPLDMTDEQIGEFTRRVSAALKIVRRTEAETGVKLNLGAGALTGEPTLLVAEANAKARSKDAIAETIMANEIADRQATIQALKVLQGKALTNPNRALGTTLEDAGLHLQQTIREQLSAEGTGMTQKAVDDQLVKVTKEFEELTGDQAKNLYNPQDYIDVVEDVAFALNSLRGTERIAWSGGKLGRVRVTGFDERIGWNGKNSRVHLDNQSRDGGVSPIVKWAKGKVQDQSNALSGSLARVAKTMNETLGFTPDAIKVFNRGPKAVRAAQGADESPLNYLAQETLDMHQLHYLRSDLLEQQRNLKKGIGTTEWRRRDLKELIEAIDTQIADNSRYIDVTKKSPAAPAGRRIGASYSDQIIQSYDMAKAATDARSSAEAKVAVKDMLVKERVGEGNNVQWVLSKTEAQPAAIMKILFPPGDARALARTLDIIGESPRSKAALGEELVKMYRTEVFDEAGNPKLAAHNKFIGARGYADHLELLFGKNGADSISTSGGLMRQVKLLQKKAIDTDNALRRTYGDKFVNNKNFYAGDIASDMFDGGLTPAQISNLKRDLKRVNPELWDDIEKHSGNWVKSFLQKTDGLEVNFNSIDNLLRKHTGRLRAIYGAKHVKNLEDLHEVTRMIGLSKMASASKQSGQPALLQVTRALLGPLSKKQRFISAVTRVYKERGNEAFRSVLTDPERLANYVRLKRMTPGSFAMVATLTELVGILPEEGARSWAESDEEMASFYQTLRRRQIEYIANRKDLMFMQQHTGGSNNYFPPRQALGAFRDASIARQMENRDAPPPDATAMDRERAARGIQ